MEEQLTEAMVELYRRTGEATGYWAHYFLREVRRKGGLLVAKNLLRPERGVSKGFERLVAAQRADLSVEALVLQEEFSPLFSTDELKEAQRRLDGLPAKAFPSLREVEDLYPQDVPADRDYSDGAVRRILVNAYERSRSARAACIRHFGPRCIVCKLDFQERYGEIGKGFIHVHHLRPVSLSSDAYTLNPKRDLVPICPNCHAMLHSHEPPLEPDQLRRRLRPPYQGGGADG